ncbi:hypothetical protein SAMN05660836_00823 [Thermodesulforhabdus norvegica]|uniref:Uncharacterized protein n=1 Tax=Thermodesulforhabdus norvegica TaxID=39841 RepID=A0A1I4S8J2_9BACT|nr:hypothetical protein SAMN05660836_00823 [Thermodesulforhabdus norvegica]
MESFLKALFLFFLVVAITYGCSRTEPLDYDELMPEELEILVRSGKTGLMPRLCYAYARAYLETPYEEWWVVGEDYKEEIKGRFTAYCADLYKSTGDSTAACYLENYYRSTVEEGEIYLAELIYYRKGCGKSDPVEVFLQSDARVLAVVEHIPSTLTYLKNATSDYDLYTRIDRAVNLFNRYLSDLKTAQENAVLYQNYVPALIESLKGLNTTFIRLKLSLKNLLNSTYVTEVIAEISRIRSLIEDLSTDVSLLSGHINKIKMTTADAYRTNKDIMLKVGKELEQFRQNKEKFLQEYNRYLE